MKKLLLALSLLSIVLFLGRNLNPFSSQMFTFHDSTQPVRIQQFVLNLKQLKIPPRVAPDFSYGLGFPVFNFYAPFSYWLTSGINLIGFDIISSLKLSFLLAIVLGFFGCFLFLKSFFDFLPSLLGGILYITSLYIPLNVFVRGNLAEIWFLALFPLGFLFIYKNSLKNNKITLVVTSIVLSFLLTSHNIFSLVSLPVIFIFIFLLKNKKQNILSLAIALLLTAYFWLPALTEMKYTWAKEVATLTNFNDHFLCPNQLWQSNWGFGGSTKGCINDGMSFKIGKGQTIFFILGILLFIYKTFIKKNRINKLFLFFLFYSLFFIFLTLYQSKPLWELLSPLLSIVQFPWRFIGPSLVGVAFFSAYFFHHLKIPLKNILIVIVLVTAVVINGRYFYGQEMKKDLFEGKFLSQEYIEKKAAYAVAEYLPKTIDYQYWRSLEKKKEIPMEFFAKSSIEPFDKNKQSFVEKIGNIITLLGFIFLIVILKWKT